jgi:nucleotide-binding universal stress UspA family protein
MAAPVGRIVVGVNGSLSSLEALRTAVDEARRAQVELWAVLAWAPVGGETGYRRSPCPPDLLRLWEGHAAAQLRNSFEEAFGGYPSGLLVHPLVVRAHPGHGLVQIADRPDDLLVVGAGERGRIARLLHGSTSRYCLAHAGCRVLAVPPPPLLKELSLRQRHRLTTIPFDELPASPGPRRAPHSDPAAPRPAEER